MRRLTTPADPAILQELREVFRRADFTVPAITALLGSAPRTDLNSSSPRLLYATRSGSTLDILIRLFIAGVPVPLEQAETALQPVPITALSKIGVLRIAAGSVTPLISILPHDDLTIASDQPSHSGKAADYWGVSE